MGFRWGTTTSFKFRIANNIGSFLSCVIFMRKGLVIATSQTSRRLWYRRPSLCATGLFANGKSRYLTPCFYLEEIGWLAFCFPPKSSNGEWHLVRKIYPSYEKPHTSYATNIMDPIFMFVTLFLHKIKLKIFINERVEFRLWDLNVDSPHT